MILSSVRIPFICTMCMTNCKL